jgi:hypothetical protein
MAEIVALEFALDANKAQMTLGDLEEGFDAMQKRLRKVGRGSEEFKQLSTAMAQTTAEIKNIELGFEGLDREQIASELGSVAGGIGDITASLVLLGGENETIEQIGASIEKAMAISMGFKGAIEGLSSARKLHNNLLQDGTIQQVKETITTSIATAKTWLLDGAKKAYAVTTKLLTGQIKIATVAQRVFNAVLKANPIALLITAFVAAGAALIAFASSTKKASREQEILKEIQEDVISGMASEQAELERLVAIAKDETQTRHARNKAIQELNKLSPEYLGNLTLETINTKEATAAIDSYTESLISQARAKALQEKLNKAVARQMELETQGLETSEAAYGALGTMLGFQAEGLQASLEARKENIKAAEDEVEAILNLIKAENKQLESQGVAALAMSGFAIDVGALEKRVAEAKAKRLKDQQEADKKAFEERKARRDIELVETKDFNEEMYVEEEEKTYHMLNFMKLIQEQKAADHEKELARIEAERQAKIEAAQQSMDLALTTLNAISDVSNTRADEDLKAEEDRFNNLRATKQLTEKQIAAEEAKSAKIKDDIRKRQFENDKKMQIAMAAINGAQALTSIFAQYPKFDGGFAMIAALASSVITTAATIAKIKATTFQSTPAPALPAIDSGDGGAAGASTAAGGAAITPVSNTSTILGGQQVFVTETDITETQNNVSVIEESATF